MLLLRLPGSFALRYAERTFLRVVVPGAATQHTVGASFSTDTHDERYMLARSASSGARRSCSRRQAAASACAVMASADEYPACSVAASISPAAKARSHFRRHSA